MRNHLIGLTLISFLSPLFFSLPVLAQTKGLTIYGAQLKNLEYRRGKESERLLAWDGSAFYGTDEVKLKWYGEAEYDLEAKDFEKLENQIVIQTPISTFFDAKVGARLDTQQTEDRWYGVVGMTGLAPQWFDVGVDLFISEKGDASARLDLDYELLLTNYLILTPAVEVNIALSDDEVNGIGSGISNVEAGLRLSYDFIDRSVSPYIGVMYERKFGKTANFARDEGEGIKSWQVIIGTSIMF